ncbi:hypothetical protein PHYBLDRAFT_119786 [Phycomyces blakesleeanus NRRL 1555(-)]|uniref:Proteinase inhibitor I78 n=1 Tax=Phycomyces blakesleeanus (strain ATCC 8743b / DSM 1359 / FGSC 10004 / NBRC 33097 / NRRL 1555) TaxID=763407 RepID=A0A167JER4_PHYB8|nr:hypothetical protein PHYBLDRAFT_119786 [Phycomyces blakesleeanus NRRL 1555(-)]OAD65849.1 hypothetical protein PHYBLDRAFT_119786 [Phycomyces blakesleeanus NRRL 1555(-)]|eukprot:XP_018283889.1 hypothetical protein PHYBLDRAFT_119786 [Phycomyces blakesleeanus NRRL 1555(-)]
MQPNNADEWKERLIGKTILGEDEETTLSSKLPKPYRLLAPGSIMTRDFNPNRLNVFIDEEKVVTNVYYC